MHLAPVIMAPQVSIGALGKMKKVLQFDENNQVVESQVCCDP